MKTQIAFGKVIKRLRLKKGLTQEELGLEADLRRTYISILELGQQQPTLKTILKLSNALGIKSSKLIEQLEKEIETETDL
jgi:transcriptional regulator with XRE-family HTH domain